MECQKAERKLSAYIDRELGEAITSELADHLSVCPGCSEKLKRMETVWADLEALPEEQITPFFYTRLMSRLQTETPFTRFQNRVLVPVSFGLVILLGIVTGSMVVSDEVQLADSAITETSITRDYIDNHLQDFPEASFAQGYMNVALISDSELGD